MIYFVRHGQTDCNRQGIIQGHLDIPLNDTGMDQAREISQKLKDKKIDVIYSSPLIRAKTTAEVINEYHNVDIIVDERLKELDAGRLQGLKFKDLTDEDKNNFYVDPSVFGAESYDQLYDRVVSLYKQLEKLDKDILIVAHGGVYRSIYRYINGINYANADIKPIDNCEYIILNDK